MRTKALPPDQLARLRRRLPTRSRIAVDIMCETGLRISDVLALRPRDLKHTVTVREIKTGNDRTVRLSPQLLRRARAYCRQHRQEFVIPCDRSTVYRDIRHAATKIGLSNISAHSCRKYYARQLRASGMTLEDVQHDLGHKSPAATVFYLFDV